MASDYEMNDAFGQDGDADIDSLASTAESEEEAEYVVNAIHAERKFYVEPDSEEDEGVFVPQYLVEWAGEKKQIAAGKVKPFDIKSWEKHTKTVQKNTEKRKEERRRKREQRARQRSMPQAEQSRPAFLDITDAHGSKTTPVAARAPRAPRQSLVSRRDSSVLFVPAETPPPSRKPASREYPEQIGSSRPAASIPQLSLNKSLIPPPSRFAKDSGVKQTHSVRPKSPPQTAKPTLFGSGTGPGNKRVYRDKNWVDRAPDLSQVEMMKPSEFSARTNMGLRSLCPSEKTPISPEAQNQSTSENPVSSTGLPNPPACRTDSRPAWQPDRSIVPACSAVAPPVPRSSNLVSTASPSSLAVLAGPNVPSNPQRPADPVVSTTSTSWPIVHSNRPAEPPLVDPPGAPKSYVLTTSLLPAAQSPLIPQAKLTGISDAAASNGSELPSGVPTGPRADSTSTKSAGPSGSSKMPLSLTIPTIPRAMGNLKRPSGPRRPQDDRESGHRSDSYGSLDGHHLLEDPPPSVVFGALAPPIAVSTAISRSTSIGVFASSIAISTAIPRSTAIGALSSVAALSKVIGVLASAIAISTAIPRSTAIGLFASSITISTAIPRSTAIGALSSVAALSSVITFSSTAPTGESVTSNLSIEAQIAKMPFREPGRGCVREDIYWWDQSLGEVLIHVFVGPDKEHLGAFRLCGISRATKVALVKGKNFKTNQVEVWFKHMCTVREYEQLCESSSSNSAVTSGWIEGFSDTNKNLFQLAEDLRKDDLIAIHYPMGRRKNNPEHAWVAWSRGSPASNFPRPHHDMPLGVPLLVAAHTRLAPIEKLALRGYDRPTGRLQSLPPDASLSHHIGLPSRREGIESGSNPILSGSHDIRMSLQSQEAPALAQAHTSPTTSETKEDTIRKSVDGFMENLKINVEELATIGETGKSSKADIFYLHFPSGDQETKQGLQILETYLKCHDKIVLTSNSPEDWARFINNSKLGVVIFHESFTGYDTLQPPLSSVLENLFNFWVVRIHRPLEFGNPRLCPSSHHSLRVFPHGRGVILLTQDMLMNLEGVAVTLQWLRFINQRKSWTLMLPPRILEWIESRLDDEQYSQDHALLLLIHSLIIKNNVINPRVALFDKSSLDPDSKSHVIAPSLDEYGTRTEHHSLKIKDKIERDADHLIEFFAGWSLINISRFRNFVVVTSLEAPAGARWDQWGHIKLLRGGFPHFFASHKVDAERTMAYFSGDTKTKDTTASQASTPVVATISRTSKALNVASHNSNGSLQSAFPDT
ncbi:Chromo domain/shadow [Penicillium paradoxum]|uniref:Chromo domain/shadow n=1 Tax=Penicillium paradoxum TaxID=176176 RepID=UPI00254902F1|nr:Chromo domain/shadow [Penicillium paradoxum]KAJ5787684.1 Chromo domain/shadow [Penicillium paradoxum]